VAWNPYEPPKADLGRASAPPPSGLSPGHALAPELEMKAMALLGRKRSSAGTISFCVAWAASAPLLLMLVGFAPALIGGAVLAGAISKVYVKSRTEAFVARVSDELGIPPGAFRPERFLI
jgi:hypothetical protein